MLNNKKAGVAFPFVYIVSLGILCIILIFFMTYFFVFGAAKSPEVTIKTGQLNLIPKLPNLLNTVQSEDSSDTIYNLVIDTYQGRKDHSQLVAKLSPILNKMNIPAEKGAIAGWNLRAFTLSDSQDKTSIPQLSVNTAVIPSQSPNVEYFNEFLSVPVPGTPDQPIILELYLACLSCSDTYLNQYA